jgi:CubicO group peptidase (beta-lactamase class C family)
MYAAEGEANADDAAKKVLKVKLEANPGSKFIYSNGNYTLLALIIEKVTNRKWEDYIKETILKPLDMNQTYFWSDQNNTGFPEVISKRKTPKRKRDYGFLGSTGIFSTASDLQKFLRGIYNEVILNDSSKSIILGKYIKLKSIFLNSTHYYSYGLYQTEGEINSFGAIGNEDAWGYL